MNLNLLNQCFNSCDEILIKGMIKVFVITIYYKFPYYSIYL